MRIDDLKTWLAANLNPFIAALSTAAIPLYAITENAIVTRDYQQPAKRLTLFLDPLPEEVQPLTLRTSEVTAKVDAIIFVSGATEAIAREQSRLYAQALLSCLETHADFFGIEDRDYYDGVEGKPDVKASKMMLVFKYEE